MLSVIIPHYHEHPQLIFTLQSLLYELEGGVIDYETSNDWEIILIDNAAYPQHEQKELDSSKYIKIKQDAGLLPNVISLQYTDCLSHWQAKNFGCESATSRGVFLFLDAHVLVKQGSINKMWQIFRHLPRESTLHLPISYMLEPSVTNELCYELVQDLDRGILDYRFKKWNNFQENNKELLGDKFVVEVPCMSTCGMMVSKQTFFNLYNGWPTSLGNYSGGEHYINFVGALLGIKHYVACLDPIHHYAAPRAYDINYNDIYRNRAIAMFLVGGEPFLFKYLNNLRTLTVGKISPRMINKLQVEIPSISELKERREHIECNSVITLENWIQRWI